jgi:hypothetical protein
MAKMYDYTLTRRGGVSVEMRLVDYTFGLHEDRNLYSSFSQKHKYLLSVGEAVNVNTICILTGAINLLRFLLIPPSVNLLLLSSSLIRIAFNY